MKESVEKRTKSFLELIEKDDKKGRKINSFLFLNPNVLENARKVDEKIKEGKAGKLAGKVIAVKSNINVKDMVVSCGSKTLENYHGSYDASVIEKIKKEDGLIIGMTNMDEFASGSSGETSAFGPTENPSASGLIPGGSSSGSAASVAADFCDLALGSDTGGSIRNPASHCGVYGLKPSYGSVSRYGLIDLSMSLDQIGPIANNLKDLELLFNVIKGRDENDPTTFGKNTEKSENKGKKLVIGISDDFKKLSDGKVYEIVERAAEILKEKGFSVKKVSLESIDMAVKAYYILVYVEFFSATRKFDGRKYGKRIEELSGQEVLRRILGGSEISKAEYRGKYYRKALAVKNAIKRDFEDAFKKCDVILSPTVPRLPHKIGEKISVGEMYGYDALTIPANFAGICALSIPFGKIDGIPVGLQLMADSFQENKLFEVAKNLI